jgi:uncharacterized membrane protein
MFSISLDTSDFESAGVNMLERKVYLVKLEDGASRLYDNRSRIAELSNHRVYSIEEINIGEALTPNQLNGIRLNGFGWVGGLTLIGVIFYMLFSGISSINPVRADEFKDCSPIAIPLKRERLYHTSFYFAIANSHRSIHQGNFDGNCPILKSIF